ncbi:hypothetical protein [Tissierella creatinophila]|uniref:Uncharacterized protein n=1 Tax=Tissierella creatinophila DSM 6911 TaxID=1123403 RepID=A0A1U7M3X6_TISCR|nr:hypothetical protein [Tissierella creatinophila]OLS01985.1 hypothetical protein TICRE_21270 [Tissierella creatinophila DSM 6911]
MKKGMMALSLAIVVGLFTTFAYADGSLDGKDLYGDSINDFTQSWGEDNLQYQENNLKRAGEENGYLNNHCGDGYNQGSRRGMGRNHMGW